MTAPPRVTFVLVSYGSRHLTVRCLASLAEHVHQPYDVVITDSASPDGTGEWLTENVVGATVLRFTENHGFGAGCNMGVRHARTEFVCFINTDVEVRAGWLEPLLEFLDRRRDVAAVAPILLNPDGTVQEAGCVVGGDGYTYIHATAEDELYARRVDYSSAACVLMRRTALNHVGGFSTAYHIAYYEDVDLAFSLAARGMESWIEPASRVIHLRGGSGSSESAVVLSRLNQATFVRRWSDVLATRFPLTGVERFPHRLFWLRDHEASFRVLLIAGSGPTTADARMMAMIAVWRSADPSASVTFFVPSLDGADPVVARLRRRGVEVVTGDRDAHRWSAERIGLYDVVVVLHGPVAELTAIVASQPQAYLVADAGRGEFAEPVTSTFGGRADLVICGDEQEVHAAELAFPGATVCVVRHNASLTDPADFATQMAEVFAECAIVPVGAPL